LSFPEDLKATWVAGMGHLSEQTLPSHKILVFDIFFSF
jgi:hypothetical protein